MQVGKITKSEVNQNQNIFIVILTGTTKLSGVLGSAKELINNKKRRNT